MRNYFAALSLHGETVEAACRAYRQQRQTAAREQWIDAAAHFEFGDPLITQDLRLSRNFTLVEHIRMTLIGEVFNLFNIANLSGRSGNLLAAVLYASRNEREKIDPRLFEYRPEEVIDGDVAYYLGGINTLLGNREAALKWLRRTVELGDVNYPWFQRDKTYDKLRAGPDYQSIMATVRQKWEANKREFDSAH